MLVMHLGLAFFSSDDSALSHLAHNKSRLAVLSGKLHFIKPTCSMQQYGLTQLMTKDSFDQMTLVPAGLGEFISYWCWINLTKGSRLCGDGGLALISYRNTRLLPMALILQQFSAFA